MRESVRRSAIILDNLLPWVHQNTSNMTGPRELHNIIVVYEAGGDLIVSVGMHKSDYSISCYIEYASGWYIPLP